MPKLSTMVPFASRMEFKMLEGGFTARQGPYAVEDTQSIELPFVDRAVDWSWPYVTPLRELALGLWCGAEFDVCVLRNDGNIKRAEYHTRAYHLRDPWTSGVLVRDFGAEWVPEDGFHVLKQKVNYPNLIRRLLTFYNAVFIDNVREKESRVFVPLPSREVSEVLVIWSSAREPLLLEKGEVPSLLPPSTQLLAPRREPRLRLNPSLPTFRTE